MTSEQEEVAQLRWSRTQLRVNQSFTAVQDGKLEGRKTENSAGIFPTCVPRGRDTDGNGSAG